MTQTAEARARALFRERFGEEPALLSSAAGRINLMGEHLDYNEGFVLPMALSLRTVLAARVRSDRQLLLHSEQAQEPAALELDRLERGGGWAAYPAGVAWALKQELGEGSLRGIEGVIASDVPSGAGLASSAALEIAVARALLRAAGRELEPLALARLCQRAENEWVGAPCGIMDQLSSALDAPGEPIFLDCKSLQHERLALPTGTALLVFDSGVQHDVGSGGYPERRAECENIAEILGLSSLRGVTGPRIASHEGELGPTLVRRARFVAAEYKRVHSAARRLRERDARRFGELMIASHIGMRDDFEISCEELDLLVSLASSHYAVLGARMTGGGFGGAVIALVARGAAKQAGREIAAQYEQRKGEELRWYIA